MGSGKPIRAELSGEAVAGLESALENLCVAITKKMAELCGGEEPLVGSEAAAAQAELDRMTRWGEKLRKLIGAAKVAGPEGTGKEKTSEEVGAELEALLGNLVREGTVTLPDGERSLGGEVGTDGVRRYPGGGTSTPPRG